MFYLYVKHDYLIVLNHGNQKTYRSHIHTIGLIDVPIAFCVS